MTDQSPPENSPNKKSGQEDPPTQPGKRLRRLTSTGQEESPASQDQAPGGSAQPHTMAYSPFDESGSLPVYTSSNSITPPSGTPIRPVQDQSEQTRKMEVFPSSETPTIPPTTGQPAPNPLPQRVSEVDRDGTQVSPTTYPSPLRPAQPPYRAAARLSNPLPPPTAPARQGKKPNTSRPGRKPPLKTGGINSKGCFLYSAVILAFIIVMAVVASASLVVFQYFSIVNSSNFPDTSNLAKHASQFETTRIFDRQGKQLYEILDPNAGRRTYVPLAKISPYLVAATLATEDKDYYNHPGFDPFAIARALWQNYTTGEVVSGASTITQQLARTLLLSAAERTDRTVQRKAREIVLASEITRRYNKEEILELYLNEIYYGNLAYGIEAASETYFHTTSDKLTMGQSSFLAGLPQAPGVYDIFSNREGTLGRQKQVIGLMLQTSQEEKCIEVSTSIQPVCVDAQAAAAAVKEIEAFEFKKLPNNMSYPHWVNYIRSILEQEYGADTIYRSGFSVYSTLDPGLQNEAERIVRDQVQAVANLHVTDGALVAINPGNGEILAMVGSADFNNDAIAGQVNMAVSPRQPGSSIKPLTYTAAFEKGWTPSTLIWDIPSQFPPSGDPNDQRDPYKPVNYDGKFHGPVTVRTALANSYNIPAVKALQYVGLYDDPDKAGEGGFIRFAQRMGISTLTRPDYGLSLTLGGGDVTLLELTSAYGIFANSGSKVPPVAITKITDYTGKVIYEYKPPAGEQVIHPEYAYLISSILSDNEARSPMFGANSVLNLPFQVAAKTGTTNDYRDNWTLGYTPDLVVGVWVGNADYTPMEHISGITGAAPIWSQFMQSAIQQLKGGNPTSFSRPPGIVEQKVCTLSGAEPSEWCPDQRSEVFADDRLPLPKEQDLWQKIQIDTWTGLKASSACNDYKGDEFVINVTDKWAVKWIQDTQEGRDWADSAGFKDPFYFPPKRECKADDPHPNILFAGLNDGQTIDSSPLDIYALVNAPKDFGQFRLEYGTGKDPASWKQLVGDINEQIKDPKLIYTWFLNKVKPGRVTLRIYLESDKNTYAEKRIGLNIQVPSPTPTSTVTPLPTDLPAPTDTPEPTDTPAPTDTPSP